MKVLVAHFTAECNEHISHHVQWDEFQVLYGEDCLDAMHVREIFERQHIELIPSIYAAINPNGMIEQEAFTKIAKTILDAIRNNVQELDGIYLQFHGASGVVGLDEVSGEHYLLREIRKIVGVHMPIAMVMDPHGNITAELCSYLNIVRCYRESPHFDAEETEKIVAEKLVDLLQDRRVMHPIIFKLPIMVGGERSVSANEPVRTINALLDKAEEDPRVFSCSYHVGYIRHDDKLGAAVVVIPNHSYDAAYCGEIAEKIAAYAWDHREEFQFFGNYDEPKQAVERAIAEGKKTTVITDSGDNCGAGGYGQNTILLKEILQSKTTKKVLIAGINDCQAFTFVSQHAIGDTFELSLRINEDENSSPVTMQVRLMEIGRSKHSFGNDKELGNAYVIRIMDTLIDVIVLNQNIQYGTMEQFEAAGVRFHDYDIVVVKMGYLDTYLIPETAYHIMALTDGPTIQRSGKIPFKKIFRPMWPIDDEKELQYIECSI